MLYLPPSIFQETSDQQGWFVHHYNVIEYPFWSHKWHPAEIVLFSLQQAVWWLLKTLEDPWIHGRPRSWGAPCLPWKVSKVRPYNFFRFSPMEPKFLSKSFSNLFFYLNFNPICKCHTILESSWHTHLESKWSLTSEVNIGRWRLLKMKKKVLITFFDKVWQTPNFKLRPPGQYVGDPWKKIS